MPSLRQELDKVVMDTLRPLCVALGPLLLWTAYADRGEYSGPAAMMPIYADLAVGTFLIVTGALAYLLRPSAKWAHPWGLAVIAMLCMTSLAALVVRGEPSTVPTMTLVALGAGIVMLSVPWLLAALLLVVVAWLVGTQGMDPVLVEPSQFLLQVALLLAAVAGWARIRAYRGIIETRDEAHAANGRIRELNDELERFAAVVTHDLQTPLSALRLKAKIASMAVAKDHDATALEALSEIERIAGESGVFVHQMLEYARSGQGLMRVEDIDMDDMLQHVQKLIEPRLMTTGGALSWHGLPHVHGDPVLVRQLVLNLVSNSVRYRHPDRPPRIEVRGQADAGGVSLTFSDNGVGLDGSDSDRLFAAFELGRADQTHGHGLGLATCKRIVEAHGGSIHAEGTPGEGARFIVELPTVSARPRPAPSPS